MDFKEKRLVSLDKSKIECYNCHRKGHFAKECRSGRNQRRRSFGDNGRSNAPTNESSSQALVAKDGLGGYDWSNDFEVEPVNYALMAISSSSSSSSSDSEIALESLEYRILGHEKNELAWDSTKNLDEILNSQMSARDKSGLGYNTQLNELSSNHETDSENSFSVFDGKTSDEESTPTNDTSSKVDGYKAVPPPITRNFLNLRVDISFAGVIIEDWTSDDEEEVSKVQTVKPETQTVKTRDDKSGQNSKKQGIDFRKVKTCFVCKSTDHLIKDLLTRTGFINTATPVCTARPSICTARPSISTARPSVSTARPVCTARPSICTARPSISTARPSVSTARPVCTSRPSISTDTPSVSATRPIYVSRPIYPRMDNVRPIGTCSPNKMSYYTKQAFRHKDFKQDVKTFEVKNITTARTRAAVNTSKGKMGNPEIVLQDHAVVDSGCSSHMTGNKAYLLDYEDFDGGFVAFGNELNFNLFSVSQMCDKKNSVLFTDTECLILSPSFKLLDESQVVLRAPRKDDVYNLDLKNIIPSGGLTCLYANTTTDESKLWHRRLGHVNFKNMNKLVKGNLVRGLPSKVFVNDHTCVACKKGKQHKASYSLGKFDGKSDEGYLHGYSTTSKAFRVYNKGTKRVEENMHIENMHIDFLEDQPNVARSRPDWMFDLDFLTNSMNYVPVSVENQVNMDAGTQDSYVAGSSGKEKEPSQEYFLLPIHPHRPKILVGDVVQNTQEKPSKNASKDKDVQDTEDATDKEEQRQMTKSAQDLQDELEKMISQELAVKAMNNDSRQAFEKEKRRIASQKKEAKATSTNILSTNRPFVSTDKPSVSTDRPFVSTDKPSVSIMSTPTRTNVGKSSFVYLGGTIPIDASTFPNADLPIDLNMPDLEDASETLSNDGIFNGAYDDNEDVGVVADISNMDNSIVVSPIPTLRIHKDHPKGQIIGDPSSAVWILVDLPFGKKEIGTKWVFRNKRYKRSIVVKNKARLVAQGHRQEEGIDYDEVFAPVARIEGIRLFLAFASYMGFLVYQIDVKSAFLYGTIEEEVYVHQPSGFVDPAYLNKVYNVVKALYGLHQAPRA
ncbi:putative ribonuclease H-like domain-containing protein, partial [Tanacetum coccineum]